MKKSYTNEFKAQAIELVSIGKPVPEVARELGINPNNIYRWIRMAEAKQGVCKAELAEGEEAAADTHSLNCSLKMTF